MSVAILRGDARCLPLPDASVDLIVTSPPYWNLRDYRDGGESLQGQIGSEETPQAYIAALLDCTREWVRVLKPSGSLFVNLGDKYANDAKWGGASNAKQAHSDSPAAGYRQRRHTGIPAKSLCGLPWRYAIGAVDQLELILRAEIIWDKPNGLPDPVADRVRRSHEQWFHLVKSPRYYSAVDEIREPHQPQSIARTGRNRFAPDMSQAGVGSPNTLNPADACNPLGKLPGSVWSIPSQPLIAPPLLGIEHFAAFPMELPRRCILGWSPPGICTACGEGLRPVVAKPGLLGGDNNPESRSGARRFSTIDGGQKTWERRMANPDRITGYTCACPDASAPTRRAVVLDPFAGTGTTMLVASALGRIGVGVERSADYCKLAAWRCSDPSERAKALGVPKPPKEIGGQAAFFEGMAG